LTTPGIELQHLAKFIVTCQNPTVTQAARELGIAPSTLSVGLRALEEQLGMHLFQRAGGHLYPLPAAFWLFQQAVSLLHIESFARATFPLPDDDFEWLRVRLNLSFSMGLFSKAMSTTVEEMRREHSRILVDFVFLEERSAPGRYADFAGTFPKEAAADVEIGYFDNPDSMSSLYDDIWVVVRLAPDAAESDSEAPLIVLNMRRALMDAISAHSARHGMEYRLRFVEEEPAQLANLLTDAPNMRFLLPRSMLAGRLGIVHPTIAPLVPGLISRVSARVTGRRDLAGIFLDQLRRTLANAETNVVFHPVLTLRQLRYFNLTQEHGGISAAARAAKIAQPSLSSQMRKLETVLARPLFERRKNRAVSTTAGQRLLPLSTSIEGRFKRLLHARQTVAAQTEEAIAIGLLPSSGHDSLMIESVADALTAFRGHYPDCRLKVVEGPSSFLHEAVRAGELNLAVVSRAQPQIARIHLGSSERLSLVANRAVGLEGRSEIGLEELCALPLVLAPNHLSMHRAIMAAASERHLKPATIMEIGSVPLVIAMVRREELCTVLPASAVRQYLRDRHLTATPIKEAVSPRSLVAIFSSERSLSRLEREIVNCLRAAFGDHAHGAVAIAARRA
jgi:molybdate transport repressor ModE-like protein